MSFINSSAMGGGMTPDEYARRRLLLAQRGGLFRAPIPQGNLAATWRAFSSNLASDAHQHGYQDPRQFMQDSARSGQPAYGQPHTSPHVGAPPPQSPFQQGQMPSFLGPPTHQSPGPGFLGTAVQNPGQGQYPPAIQGFMNAENPQIKELLARALAALAQANQPAQSPRPNLPEY
jgi:hypothetical protein